MWNTSRASERMAWTSPVIAHVNGVPKVIAVGQRHVNAYNPNSGQLLWQQGGMSGEPGASAATANGIIYVASEGARMMAINGADGERLWENREHLPDISSPVATNDNVFLATNYGIIAAINTQDGSVRASHEVRHGFFASPIIAEGRVYFVDTQGIFYVFSADNDFRLLETFATGERTYATPAFTDGRIVVRTENSLYSVVR
jgi:outer membrane protein assembly factor BamB